MPQCGIKNSKNFQVMLRTEAFVSWESDRNKVKTEMNAYSCKAPPFSQIGNKNTLMLSTSVKQTASNIQYDLQIKY